MTPENQAFDPGQRVVILYMCRQFLQRTYCVKIISLSRDSRNRNRRPKKSWSTYFIVFTFNFVKFIFRLQHVELRSMPLDNSIVPLADFPTELSFRSNARK